MIDLHSHLIPGVDDGARTVDQSVRVLGGMRATGVTAVCLTPHLPASRAAAGIPAEHDRGYDAVVAAAPEGVELHRGVELMLDRPLTEEAAVVPGLTLGGSRYLLVEFTRLVAASAAQNALARVAELGLVPVLAHPERYACATPDQVRAWKRTGALMQVDANTLFADRTRGERARALVAAGLADILAADNHGDDRMLAGPFASLCENEGSEQAELLCTQNPAAILADRLPEAVPPLRLRTSLLARLRHLLSPEP